MKEYEIKQFLKECFFARKKSEYIPDDIQFKIMDRILSKDLLAEKQSISKLLHILEKETRIALSESVSPYSDI